MDMDIKLAPNKLWIPAGLLISLVITIGPFVWFIATDRSDIRANLNVASNSISVLQSDIKAIRDKQNQQDTEIVRALGQVSERLARIEERLPPR